MTAFKKSDAVPVCCLSLRQSMNLRKTRFSSGQKKTSSGIDIKSPVKKRKSQRLLENTKFSSKNLPKTPVKSKKSSINLVTSTPIPHEIKKTISRKSNRCNSPEIAEHFFSLKRKSCPIISSPIQRISYATKPCEVRLIRMRPMVERYSGEKKTDLILRGNAMSSSSQSSYFSLNSSVKALRRSTRNSKAFQSQNTCKEVSDDLLSKKLRSARKISIISKRHLSKSQKTVEKLAVPQNEVRLHNIKDIRKSLKSENVRSMLDKSQKSRNSLLHSFHEIENSKPSRRSLRLQNQQLFTTAFSNVLPSKSDVMHQNKTKTQKYVLKPRSDNAKRNKHSLRISKNGSSKKTADSNLSLKYSSKKTTSAKKQKLAKNVNQNITSEQYKESTGISKKQKTNNKFIKHRCLSLPGGDIPIDDLALSAKCDKRKVKSEDFRSLRKKALKERIDVIQAVIKADEDYQDDLYESKAKNFDKFKELLMDTSDSEMSFAIATPKFPNTPHIRHRTPKYKDCFSPTEYAASRKAAMEYMHIRNKKRKVCQKPSDTPVIPERKQLEYSQVLEEAQNLQKTIESLEEEESDNDSYFSFC